MVIAKEIFIFLTTFLPPNYTDSMPFIHMVRYITFVQPQSFTGELEIHSARRRLLKTIGCKITCVLSVSKFLNKEH